MIYLSSTKDYWSQIRRTYFPMFVEDVIDGVIDGRVQDGFLLTAAQRDSHTMQHTESWSTGTG